MTKDQKKPQEKLAITRLSPTMTRDEIKENLLVVLKANGFTIKPNSDPKDTHSTK